jgi:hypothetical protein
VKRAVLMSRKMIALLFDGHIVLRVLFGHHIDVMFAVSDDPIVLKSAVSRSHIYVYPGV